MGASLSGEYQFFQKICLVDQCTFLIKQSKIGHDFRKLDALKI